MTEHHKIMVDLDNTLLDFNQMFANHLKDKYNIEFDVNKITTYDMDEAWTDAGILEWAERSKYFEEIANDETFYEKYAVKTSNYERIWQLLLSLREEASVEIVLHTSCIGETMIAAKKRYIETNQDFERFDSMIFENIKGVHLNTTKDTDYTLIIDDSPTVVTNYLDNNANGRVLLPLTLYNRHLLKLDEYNSRILPLLDGKIFKQEETLEGDETND